MVSLKNATYILPFVLAASAFYYSKLPSSSESVRGRGEVLAGERNHEVCGQGKSLFVILMEETSQKIALCDDTDNPRKYVDTMQSIEAIKRMESGVQRYVETRYGNLPLSDSPPIYLSREFIGMATILLGLLGAATYLNIWISSKGIGHFNRDAAGVSMNNTRNEEKRKEAFRKWLEHVERTSGKEHADGLNSLDGIVRVYYNQAQGKHFTYDGTEVEVTPIGENSPQLLNFHWSNSQDGELKVISSAIVKEARKYGANAFMIGKPENAHGNNVYGYTLLRAETISTLLASPMKSYQLQPSGQLLPRNSGPPFRE